MASREQEVEGKEKGRRHEYGLAFQRSRTLTLTIFKDPNVLCPWSDAADAMLPGGQVKIVNYLFRRSHSTEVKLAGASKNTCKKLRSSQL